MGIEWQDRISALGAKLGSREVLPEIEAELENAERLREALIQLRTLATTLHRPEAASASKAAEFATERPQPRKATSSVTMGYLIELYKTHEKSAYHGLRFATRKYYDTLLRRLEFDCGNSPLSELREPEVLGLYEGWLEGGAKLPMAHSLITMFRSLVYFGGSVLEDPDCIRLAVQLRTMRFEIPKTRTERLTEQHVRAIIAKAHEMGRPSIAAAQAFQFECGLHQKDVIGEIVPINEPEHGIVYGDDQKWVRGIQWSEVSNDLILKHVQSNSGDLLTCDLKTKPLTLDQINYLRDQPQYTGRGPIIISEYNNQPWYPNEFRRWWRKVADAAGVPKNIRNSDSRDRRRLD